MPNRNQVATLQKQPQWFVLPQFCPQKPESGKVIPNRIPTGFVVIQATITEDRIGRIPGSGETKTPTIRFERGGEIWFYPEKGLLAGSR